MNANVVFIRNLFAAVGVLLLLGSGSWALEKFRFIETATHAEGEVIDLERIRSSDNSVTWAPVVQFTTLQGETFQIQSSSSSNPPLYAVGEKIEVLYSPDSPHDAEMDGFFSLWGGILIMVIIGAGFTGMGGGMILYASRRASKKKSLLETGVPVEVPVKAVHRNENITVNGRNPFVLMAEWFEPVSNRMYIFESDHIWFDPTAYLGEGKLRVYVDQHDPANYWVDTSFLPRVVG